MPYVKVPGGMGVTVSARNAGVDVAGLVAALDVTTVNGDVSRSSTLARSKGIERFNSLAQGEVVIQCARKTLHRMRKYGSQLRLHPRLLSGFGQSL
ncbi:hypothetical protein [Streptomyces cacaoi]|uniref:hypothetical protein n=1 Tax=Streptomyces cacaoi TaxID=1898 RepID=UPI00374A8C1E